MASTAVLTVCVLVFGTAFADIDEVIETLSSVAKKDPVTLYDPTCQVCCNLTVHDQPDVFGGDNSYLECCGDVTIDTRGAICCNGKPQKLPRQAWGRTYKCCGDNPFDPYSEVCCIDQVFRQKSACDGKHSCCGRELYNTKSSLCCKDTVFEKTGEFQSCCGDRPYSSEKELCCHGFIKVNKTWDWVRNPMKRYSASEECCGPTATYNSASEMCCYDYQSMKRHTLKKRCQFDSCCGNTTYNYKTERCCHNYDSGSDKSDYFVVKQSNPHVRCCGNSTYDSRFEKCCKNLVINVGSEHDFYSCCGNVTYDWRSQICCSQKILPKLSPTTKCCGNGTYEKHSELCCDGSAMPIDDPVMSDCCGKKVYNLDREVCCNADVVQKTDRKKSACCPHSSFASSRRSFWFDWDWFFD